MSFNVLSTSSTFGYYALEPLDYLKSNGCRVERVPQGKKLTEAELIEKLKHVDALIVGVEEITEPVLHASKNLKIIAKLGAGIDNIDVPAASRRGVMIINAPSGNSDAVAELTMGLMISLARKIPFIDHCVKDGGWPSPTVGVQLSGKTLGIIGLGDIGKKVARRALAFNMKVIAYDLVRDEDVVQKQDIHYLPLEHLLAESDVVSIHVALNPATRKRIGDKELGLMKPEAFLLNMARGEIIDDAALYKALKEKRIKGAALDVFTHEPPVGNPLLKLDNVIFSSHLGGYTIEALRENGMTCAIGIVERLHGRQPATLINPEVLS